GAAGPCQSLWRSDSPQFNYKEIEVLGVKDGSWTVLQLVEALGSCLENADPRTRGRGIQLLSEVLLQCYSLLQEKEVLHLVLFYENRLQDHHLVIPSVLQGLRALVSLRPPSPQLQGRAPEWDWEGATPGCRLEQCVKQSPAGLSAPAHHIVLSPLLLLCPLQHSRGVETALIFCPIVVSLSTLGSRLGPPHYVLMSRGWPFPAGETGVSSCPVSEDGKLSLGSREDPTVLEVAAVQRAGAVVVVSIL
uniref:MMS19 nucleotide excision repair protein n=1 Tax=Dromaius novaehollandiae TaxID=8790 RepID=A0A8C4KA20_DRONO